MKIKKISHVAFRCTDIEKSLHFYVSALGLKRVFDIETDDKKPWIIYLKVCKNQFIELFYNKPDDIKCDNLSYAHICLEVKDIEKAAAHIRKCGYAVTEPHKGKDLNIQAWVKDPDGNPIELMQFDKESPQAKA